MRQRVDRFPTNLDQHAEREQSRTPDSMLAVNEYFFAAFDPLSGESDAAIQSSQLSGLHVGSW